MSNTPIELKSSSFILSMAHLHEAEPKVIHRTLEDKIARAPAFLRHAPVVLSVSALETPINWSAMHKTVSTTSLWVVGISGCKDTQLEAEIGKMRLPILTEREERVSRPTPTPQTPVQNTMPVTKTRLIDTPVRSDQRVYAPQCDLIVMSHVSARAELIADGNIHVYGMMRGRTLVGTSGDQETQIFCADLMVGLVSTTGEYWLSDQVPAELYNKAARLQLVENTLAVQPLD